MRSPEKRQATVAGMKRSAYTIARAAARDSGRFRAPVRTRRRSSTTRGANTYAKKADRRNSTPTPSIARSMRSTLQDFASKLMGDGQPARSDRNQAEDVLRIRGRAVPLH